MFKWCDKPYHMFNDFVFKKLLQAHRINKLEMKAHCLNLGRLLKFTRYAPF